jgi:nucleotide-binding universal stress UspA family protein
MAGEIVLGYDGSPGARRALRLATELASTSKRALVIVFGYAPTPMGGEVADLARAVRELGAVLTEDAVEMAHNIDNALAVTTELVDGRPADALLAAADEHEAYMLVVGGADGRGPVRGALLGSVTYQVVHRATRPVLVVPADVREDD